MSTLAEHARKSTKERSVEREILDLLAYHGWLARKHDVIHAVVDHGARGKRRVNIGSVGDPDIWAVRPHPHRSVFHFLLIECKRRVGGRLSPAQEAAHAVLRKQGYVVVVARSWGELVTKARDAGVEVERKR